MVVTVTLGFLVELLQVGVLGGVLAYLVDRSRQEGVSGERGWNWILAGLWTFLVWSVLDLLDNFPRVAGDPAWQVVDEVLVDVLPAGGAIALAVGLAYWLPYPAHLEELTGTLTSRVEERTRELAESEARIRAQRDQLEILNRLVRHDIRNDMTAVLSVADALREDAPDQFQEDLDRMVSAGEHVVELTETARTLVEVIRRGEAFQAEPTALVEALEGELRHVQGLYEEARLQVRGNVPDVDVEAGPLLTSVFRNLLNNAVLHNDKEVPEVTVTADVQGGQAEVRVADNGPGVPDGVRETLFEAPEDPLDPDSSMGMYLVQRVVSAYGGSVRVEDNDPEGAAFVVTLPLADGDG